MWWVRAGVGPGPDPLPPTVSGPTPAFRARKRVEGNEGDCHARDDQCRYLRHRRRFPFAENDRARAERRTSGQVKVVVTTKGDILGASIVGAHAGELLQPWVLAIGQRLKIGALANMIAPYPTLGEVNKRVAGSFYTPTLFSERTRKVVRFLGMFG
jgi:hypothetical protein